MIKSRQTIDSYADCISEHKGWTQNAVEDYQALKQDIAELIENVNTITSELSNGDFSPQFGTGSPEGVVTANYSLLYIDTAVPQFYYNETFGADTGWVVV